MKAYNRIFLLPRHASILDQIENNSDFTITDRVVSFNKNTGLYSVYVRFEDVDDFRPESEIPTPFAYEEESDEDEDEDDDEDGSDVGF